ncbi:MAG: LuxR C-terminal-related transcriptional regulator [Sporichthyaceae bacterium]
MSTPFPPSTTTPGWRSGGVELGRRVRLLADAAEALLGIAFEVNDVELRAAARAVQDACLARLRGGARDAEAAALLVEAAGCLDDISVRVMSGRARRLAECERGLARLREISTTAGLIDGVCDELIRCLGFERTMLARVESGMWRPWKANASMLTEAWVDDWIERSIPLDDLTLETRLLRERRPALILDTNQPGIAQMVHAAGVRSYVAAPIMPGGQVVGFFHADHGVLGRACDTADRDLLWTFAEGFGHLYERTALLEQLHARTEQVRRTVSGLAEAMDELTDAELTLGDAAAEPGSARSSVVQQGLASRLGQFTSRELEVLELIVAGARNIEIAQRLTISVGTVKSHVKNILAKLGVLNRSQAIALYLGATELSRENGDDHGRAHKG